MYWPRYFSAGRKKRRDESVLTGRISSHNTCALSASDWWRCKGGGAGGIGPTKAMGLWGYAATRPRGYARVFPTEVEIDWRDSLKTIRENSTWRKPTGDKGGRKGDCEVRGDATILRLAAAVSPRKAAGDDRLHRPCSVPPPIHPGR